jgi:diguanylate cyclase (GGDEF)-like protein
MPCCPAQAIAYRYGGEELAALLPGANREDLLFYAESVRTQVADLAFPEASGLKITISLGVTLMPEDSTNHRELTKKADDALYAAKHSGRNRVCSA